MLNLNFRGCFSVLLLSLAISAYAEALDERYYGSISLETGNFDYKNSSEKTYGTNVEIFSKESPLKYNFGIRRGEGLGGAGNVFYINPSYKVGALRVGVLLRNDELGDFSDKAFTFGAELDAISQGVVPYAYGHLGVRSIKGKGDADNYLVRLGLKKGLYRLELENKYIGSVSGYGSVSTTTLNPRAEFLLSNSGDWYFGVNYQRINVTGADLIDFKRVNLTEASLKTILANRDVVTFSLFERVGFNGLNQKTNDLGAYVKYSKYF